MVGLNDSGGARIQEGVRSLGGYADIFIVMCGLPVLFPDICHYRALCPAAQCSCRRIFAIMV